MFSSRMGQFIELSILRKLSWIIAKCYISELISGQLFGQSNLLTRLKSPTIMKSSVGPISNRAACKSSSGLVSLLGGR